MHAAAGGLERGGKGTHKLAAASLLFAAETAEEVVDHAVQIHGGYGYMEECEICWTSSWSRHSWSRS